MKRFLIFDSATNYHEPVVPNLLIGDFDRAEDLLVHANWPTTKVPFFSHGMYEVEILDTDTGEWHVMNLLLTSDEEKVKAREGLAHITNSHPPVGVRRYMLFGLDTYQSSGGMRDYLHSFDTPKACVAALQAFANGDKTELSNDWDNLDIRNTLVLFDRVAMREMEVHWRDYSGSKGIYPNYQDFLQFETKSESK